MQTPEISDKLQARNVSHADAFRHACWSLFDTIADEVSVIMQPTHGMTAPLETTCERCHCTDALHAAHVCRQCFHHASRFQFAKAKATLKWRAYAEMLLQRRRLWRPQ